MSNSKDVQRIAQNIMGTAEAMGQVLSPNAAGLMAADLAAFPADLVHKALHRARIEERGRLTLSVVLQQLDALCGRLGQEEAWALALQAKDEANTVVWTDEIAQAWGIAVPLAKGRDTVGARMAFKEAYTRITQTARAARKRPVVQVSIGYDPALRLKALGQACEQGLLTVEQAQEHLHGVAALENGRLVALAVEQPPAIAYRPDGTPYKQASSQQPLGVAQLLTSSATLPASSAPPWVVQRLQQLTASITRNPFGRQQAKARLARMQEAQRKRDVAAAVRQYVASNPEAASATNQKS